MVCEGVPLLVSCCKHIDAFPLPLFVCRADWQGPGTPLRYNPDGTL